MHIRQTPARMEEYDLKEMWKSPNGTLRAILDGTVFVPYYGKLYPSLCDSVKEPITMARHAYGDIYRNKLK